MSLEVVQTLMELATAQVISSPIGDHRLAGLGLILSLYREDESYT